MGKMYLSSGVAEVRWLRRDDGIGVWLGEVKSDATSVRAAEIGSGLESLDSSYALRFLSRNGRIRVVT
jgi:hypothetical protein